MKIAMVSEGPLDGTETGGRGVHVETLSRALSAAGHSVVIYVLDSAAEGTGQRTGRGTGGRTGQGTRRAGDRSRCAGSTGAGERFEVKVVPVPAQTSSSEPGDQVPGFGEQLAKAWLSEPPDIVHTHHWVSGLAGLAALSRGTGLPAEGLSSGPPMVHTFHGLGTALRRGRAGSGKGLAERIRLERVVAAGADHIIATSREEIRELALMGVRPERVSAIPCGVDTTHFSPDGPARSRGSRPRLLAMGRLLEHQCYDTLITALRGVPDAELIIAGGPRHGRMDSDPVASRLRAVARQNGVAHRFHLAGRVPHDRMPELVRSADAVICVPSYEPVGLSILEAMACGRAVIASPVGGSADSVVEGATGTFCPPRRPGQLARTIRRLLSDPIRLEGFGVAARDRVERRYSRPYIADQTAEVYRRVLGERVPAEPRDVRK